MLVGRLCFKNIAKALCYRPVNISFILAAVFAGNVIVTRNEAIFYAESPSPASTALSPYSPSCLSAYNRVKG